MRSSEGSGIGPPEPGTRNGESMWLSQGALEGMEKNKFQDATQFAALPWRIGEAGTRQVMLLTSRETRRWVIPKGWPMKGRKPAEVASREAYEEAGLVGQIVGKRPIGIFHYEKRLGTNALLCEVQVFSFWVNKQLDDAITRVRTLPDEQQREAAQILLEFLDLEESDMRLTPEQIAEIERRSSDDESSAAPP